MTVCGSVLMRLNAFPILSLFGIRSSMLVGLYHGVGWLSSGIALTRASPACRSGAGVSPRSCATFRLPRVPVSFRLGRSSVDPRGSALAKPPRAIAQRDATVSPPSLPLLLPTYCCYLPSANALIFIKNSLVSLSLAKIFTSLVSGVS